MMIGGYLARNAFRTFFVTVSGGAMASRAASLSSGESGARSMMRRSARAACFFAAVSLSSFFRGLPWASSLPVSFMEGPWSSSSSRLAAE